MQARLLLLLALAFPGGCATAPEPVPAPPPAYVPPTASVPLPPAPHDFASRARIIPTRRPVECVAYARRVSGIAIHGDAWRWWAKARGRYRRGHVPEPGAVLVLRRRGDSAGHLAVVTRLVRAGLILVDHANWLNHGRIHKATPVEDVSAKGDWSAVRVWYTPGHEWGLRTYGAYGFIYPEAVVAGP